MDYLVVVLLVAAVATAFVVIARSSAMQDRRSRDVRQRQLALAKRAAEADVIGLAEVLNRLADGAEGESASLSYRAWDQTGATAGRASGRLVLTEPSSSTARSSKHCVLSSSTPTQTSS